MKLIDEKGRIFKKVNLIDLLVVLFIISLFPMFYFGYKTIAEKNQIVAPDKVVIIKLLLKNVHPEISKAIKPGDKQISLDGLGTKIVEAEISSIISNLPSKIVTLQGDGRTWNIADHPEYRDLILKIKVNTYEKADGLFIGQENQAPVRIGNDFVFTNFYYTVSGLIIDLDT